MGRKRSPKRKRAFEIWVASSGQLSNADIGRMVGVSEDLIRKWKREDDWECKRPEHKSPTNKAASSGNPDSTSRGGGEDDDAATRKNDAASRRKRKRGKPGITIEHNISDDDAEKQAQSFRLCFGDDLTDTQRLFCIYYINSFNASLSYRRVHPDCKRVSANVEGYKALQDPRIRAYIGYLKRLRMDAMFMQAGDIVEQYMRIAFANINQIAVVKNGKVHIANSDDIDGQLVQEITANNGNLKIKMCDKMKALDWLSNYFELNPKDKHRKEYDEKMLAIRQKELELKAFYV